MPPEAVLCCVQGDATECLVELVDLMSKATTNTEQKDVRHIFALDQSEHVLCRNPACGAATEPSLESTPVHYVYVREISYVIAYFGTSRSKKIVSHASI